MISLIPPIGQIIAGFFASGGVNDHAIVKIYQVEHGLTHAKVDVLLLDDWGVAMLTDSARRDLLEILDDRYNRRPTIITSQLKVEDWHESIGDPILADAILDRLVHNAHKLNLSGESMRKRKSGLTKPTDQE